MGSNPPARRTKTATFIIIAKLNEVICIGKRTRDFINFHGIHDIRGHRKYYIYRHAPHARLSVTVEFIIFERPAILTLPTNPAIPAISSIPSVPAIPTIPAIPAMPSVPVMPAGTEDMPFTYYI
ncbi:hypothetical protein TKK_0008725 [Trichogramma kaykai]